MRSKKQDSFHSNKVSPVKPSNATYPYPRKEQLMFRIEKVDGSVLVEMDDEQDAILEARQHLEDDPELGEVYVATDDRYLWRATHAPDHFWNTIVVVIPFDERITTPTGAKLDPHEDLLGAYADNWAKRVGLKLWGAIW